MYYYALHRDIVAPSGSQYCVVDGLVGLYLVRVVCRRVDFWHHNLAFTVQSTYSHEVKIMDTNG